MVSGPTQDPDSDLVVGHGLAAVAPVVLLDFGPNSGVIVDAVVGLRLATLRPVAPLPGLDPATAVGEPVDQGLETSCLVVHDCDPVLVADARHHDLGFVGAPFVSPYRDG